MSQMSQTRQVPKPLYTFLSAATVARTADLMLRDRSAHDHSQGALHPGDRFGDYLTWLWREDQRAELCLVLTDLIAELRDRGAGGDPAITLENLLAGVRLAVYHLTDDETDALVDLAREEVPKYYGSDPDHAD